MVYVDSNVFIYPIIYDERSVEEAKRSTILNAQRLMDEYGLKPRDAIHAAAALENRIDTIVSYDKDFDEVRGLKRVEP